MIPKPVYRDALRDAYEVHSLKQEFARELGAFQAEPENQTKERLLAVLRALKPGGMEVNKKKRFFLISLDPALEPHEVGQVTADQIRRVLWGADGIVPHAPEECIQVKEITKEPDAP